MYDNKLTGSLPSSIGTMTALIILNLYANKLTGSIPTTVALMSSLTTLKLTGNSLTGTVPSQLCLLTKLTTFTAYQSNKILCSTACTKGDTAYCMPGELYNYHGKQC